MRLFSVARNLPFADLPRVNAYPLGHGASFLTLVPRTSASGRKLARARSRCPIAVDSGQSAHGGAGSFYDAVLTGAAWQSTEERRDADR
jgi:hypothetical protein